MSTVKELREQAKAYGLPWRSMLNKSEPQTAIADLRAAEYIKRLKRAQITGRFSSIRKDIENPHKRGLRARELRFIDEEVHAALRAQKYVADSIKKPRLRRAPLKRITDRALSPPKPLKESLIRSIVREAQLS